MDPSALIFVALAVAWLAYLVPRVLEHHEAGEHGRSISDFSHRVRVLGRREAVDSRTTALVTPTPASSKASATSVAEQTATPTRSRRPAARRPAARRAVTRRRRVLGVLLLLLTATVVTALLGRVSMVAVAVPVALVVAWLVACRLMVRTERAAPTRRPVAPASPSAHSTGVAPRQAAEPDATAPDTPAHTADQIPAEVVDSGGHRWDPVDVPLPTYVNKPAAARRTVRTIDLDGTGVWSSGRNEADSALAREAEAARQTEPAERADRRTGS